MKHNDFDSDVHVDWTNYFHGRKIIENFSGSEKEVEEISRFIQETSPCTGLMLYAQIYKFQANKNLFFKVFGGKSPAALHMVKINNQYKIVQDLLTLPDEQRIPFYKEADERYAAWLLSLDEKEVVDTQ